MTLGKTPEACPRALKGWLREASVESGPLFRGVNRWGHVQQTAVTDQVVASLVKKYTRSAGLDADIFSGHSLRAGLATSAALAGAGERLIMKQTRHKSEAMVRRYVRDANMFNQNVSGIVGL